MIVVLLGPPGVGKGTQAAALAGQEDGWTHLSTGDLLRAEVEAGSELGRAARRYMDAGDLVPDEVMVGMVADRISRTGPDQVLLLDGFPRTPAQAEALAAAAPGGSIRLALYFSASDPVLEARLMGRGRSDDTREVIQRRLEVYRETTAPLIAWYRDQGILREVDAERSIEAIQEDVAGTIRSVLQEA